jgi:hypothetical protein
MNDWTQDIDNVLDQIRINSVILSKQHKKRYFYLIDILQYFRLPVIIMSGINSIISVGLQPYLNQGTISMMTCLLALVCSIIGSIELYLTIQKSAENELLASKDYYILSIDIHKTLSLSKHNRPIPAKEYLDKKYDEYVKLYENSNLLSKKIIDSLNPLPEPNLHKIVGISSKYFRANSTDEEASVCMTPQPSAFSDEESKLSPFQEKRTVVTKGPSLLLIPEAPQVPRVLEKEYVEKKYPESYPDCDEEQVSLKPETMEL